MHAALPSHRDGSTQDMDSCSLLHGHQVRGRLEPHQSAENDQTRPDANYRLPPFFPPRGVVLFG